MKAILIDVAALDQHTILKKYKQPLLMATKIRDEVVLLAPELHSILTGK